MQAAMIVAIVLGFAQGFLAIAILFALIDPFVEKAFGRDRRMPMAVKVVSQVCAFVVLAGLYFGLSVLWLTVVLPRQGDPTGLIFKAWLVSSFAGLVVWGTLRRFIK